MHRNSPHAHPAAGYVTDVAYPETYFRELSPVWLNYVAALGHVPPRDLERPFTYLELGCGLGSSTLTHAAAFPAGRFHACDINRAHIEHAKERAGAFGIGNIELYHCPFEELPRAALPAFDFIVAHGVYSWVGGHERRCIRDLVREHLKPGGLLYLSYNSLPGWAAEMPLRKLLVELAAGDGDDSTTRAGRALRSLKHLSEGKLRYLEANPACAAAVTAYTRAPVPYIAHEFLNAAWEGFYGIDVADQLQEAGVAYVGSATLTDNHPALLADAATLGSIAQLPGERQRRLALDFATNQQFRRDVFWRPTSLAGATGLDSVLVGCMDDLERVQVRVPRGIVHFPRPFILRLRDLLMQGPARIGEAAAELAAASGGAASDIHRNLLYLVAAGALTPFAKQSGVASAAARPCQPANDVVERVLEYSIAHQVPCVAPSEVLGSGVRIGAAEATSLKGYLEGGSGGPECAGLVRRLLRLGVLREGRQ